MGVGWEYGSRDFLEHPMFSVEVPPGQVAITGIKLKFMTINALLIINAHLCECKT